MRSEALGLALLLLGLVALVAALTGVYLWDFSQDCGSDGGVFSIEGGTAWCRY